MGCCQGAGQALQFILLIRRELDADGALVHPSYIHLSPRLDPFIALRGPPWLLSCQALYSGTMADARRHPRSCCPRSLKDDGWHLGSCCPCSKGDAPCHQGPSYSTRQQGRVGGSQGRVGGSQRRFRGLPRAVPLISKRQGHPGHTLVLVRVGLRDIRFKGRKARGNGRRARLSGGARRPMGRVGISPFLWHG